VKTSVQGSRYLNLCLGQSFIHFALLSGIFWFLQLIYHLQEKIGVQIDYSAGLHTALRVFQVSPCVKVVLYYPWLDDFTIWSSNAQYSYVESNGFKI